MLGFNRFDVPYLDASVELAMGPASSRGTPQETSNLLVILTTNQERELPAAFARRCLVWTIEHPKPDELVRIARWHFDTPTQPFGPGDVDLARALALRLAELREAAPRLARRPSTAEFLDAFRACRARGVHPVTASAQWRLIEQLTLAKPDETPF